MTGEITTFASSLGFPSRYDAYRSEKRSCGLSDKSLQALIACQISHIKDLDFSHEKVYSSPQSHIIQSLRKLST
jgi:hypothetical protein